MKCQFGGGMTTAVKQNKQHVLEIDVIGSRLSSLIRKARTGFLIKGIQVFASNHDLTRYHIRRRIIGISNWKLKSKSTLDMKAHNIFTLIFKML